MKSTFRTITHVTLTVFILFTSAITFAQTDSKTVFKDKKAGLSFEVPMGWNADFAIGGYLLRSSSHDGSIMIFPLDAEAIERTFISLSSPTLLDIQGVQLTQRSEAYYSTYGFLMAKMEGQMGWKDMKVYACLVQTYTKGSFIILAGSPEEVHTHYYEKIAENIAKSLKIKRRSFELLASAF